MIDEINYFPRRENYQKKKKVESDWGKLKKTKTQLDSKKKSDPEMPKKSDPPPRKD